MTRVALILDGAGWAGTERHVHGLMVGLARGGWSVELITSEVGPLTEAAAALSIPSHLVPRRHSLRYVTALCGTLRRLRPDVVHAHSGRLACLAARLSRVPVVVETRHGLPESIRPVYRRIPITRRWEGLKSRLPHRTVTVCDADARWLREEGGLSPDRLRVVVNGIPPDRVVPARADPPRGSARRAWGLPEEARLLGFIGRLCHQKAPHRVFELLAYLSGPNGLLPPGGDLLLVVCGDGPAREALQERARRLGLAARVIWLGARPGAEALLPALDLLLLPSLWEGMPYVLLEALRAGVPVLAAPVGGVPELLRGEVLTAGCRPWEVGAWASAAAEMLSGPRWRKDWEAAARARIAECPEDRTVAEIEGVYRELLRLPCLPGAVQKERPRA